MPEYESQAVVTLLWVCVGLLLVLAGMGMMILRRLARLERMSPRERATPANAAEAAPPAVETSAGGAFEAFLEENPARRELAKNEQFKAYRKWRQEKGLNWSNS